MHFASVPTATMFTKLVQSGKTPQVRKWMKMNINPIRGTNAYGGTISISKMPPWGTIYGALTLMVVMQKKSGSDSRDVTHEVV